MNESADWKCHVFCDYADLKAAESKIAEQAKALENARSELLEAGFSINSGVVAMISAALREQEKP